MREFFIAAAGLSGALAVGLGAMGAHAFVGKPDDMKEVWKVCSYATCLFRSRALNAAQFRLDATIT